MFKHRIEKISAFCQFSELMTSPLDPPLPDFSAEVQGAVDAAIDLAKLRDTLEGMSLGEFEGEDGASAKAALEVAKELVTRDLVKFVRHDAIDSLIRIRCRIGKEYFWNGQLHGKGISLEKVIATPRGVAYEPLAAQVPMTNASNGQTDMVATAVELLVQVGRPE